MNVYITTGTYEYLQKIQQKYPNENMVIIQNEDTAQIVHETNVETVFNEPRRYEVVDSAGRMQEEGFAVLNNIPVTDEGRPVFEYRFKNRARMIENEPGFIAIRVLRPLTSNTYIILTLWEKEQAFENWQASKSFAKAHAKKGAGEGSNTGANIFSGASYVTKYNVVKE